MLHAREKNFSQDIGNVVWWTHKKSGMRYFDTRSVMCASGHLDQAQLLHKKAGYLNGTGLTKPYTASSAI